jgi:hypothetical protein
VSSPQGLVPPAAPGVLRRGKSSGGRGVRMEAGRSFTAEELVIAQRALRRQADEGILTWSQSGGQRTSNFTDIRQAPCDDLPAIRLYDERPVQLRATARSLNKDRASALLLIVQQALCGDDCSTKIMRTTLNLGIS